MCIKLTKRRQVNTHGQGGGLQTDVLNQRRSTLVLISFLSSYIFVLIASCIFTMHLFSVLPCLVKKNKTQEKHYLYYSDNILWSVFLISILCSNIFSHAAIGQRMRHKKRKRLFVWKGYYAILYAKQWIELNWNDVVPIVLLGQWLFWVNGWGATTNHYFNYRLICSIFSIRYLQWY